MGRKKLQWKVFSLVLISVLVFAACLTYFTYSFMRWTIIDFYSVRAQEVSAMVANLVDGDAVLRYVEMGRTDEDYEQLKELFGKLKEDSGVNYLYIFYPREDSFIYILDASIEDGSQKEDISKFGDVYQYGETEYTYLIPDMKAGRASNQVILGKDVGFGESVSAWSPVFSSAGELAAMVEADFFLKDAEVQILAYVMLMIFMIFIGIILLLVILLWRMRKTVLIPVGTLTNVVSSYQDGAFSLPEKGIETGDEMQTLYDAFCEMINKIDRYVEDITKVTAEKERIGAELNVATNIQANMLPSIFPPFPNRQEFDLYAAMDPAKEVGGDFYDFFMTDEDHLALIIADVSGKGVPAALFMVIAKTLLKNAAQQGLSVKEIMERVNRQLCENNKEEMFVTVWMGLLQISTGRMICANAGHEYPAISREGGEFALLKDKHGFVMAGMEMARYREYELEFHPGDRLFVYTDGVTEATNSTNTLFGTDRMLDALNKNKDLGCDGLLKGVREEIDAFVGEAPQFDDITMLTMVYKGQDEKSV